MADADEAAAIVNALQRHAPVVCQKSLAEGFGLTVAEAMWKTKPIVANAAGGITDQIVTGEHGLLIDDPHDLPAFGTAIEHLLRTPAERPTPRTQRPPTSRDRVPRRPAPRTVVRHPPRPSVDGSGC